MSDSGYRAFHDGCGGMVAFGTAGDGFCTACEDENVSFSDYTLIAVKPPAADDEDREEWLDIDGRACTPGCPDDTCRSMGTCAWPPGARVNG